MFNIISEWSKKSIIDEVILIAIIIAICETIAQNFIKYNNDITMFFGLTFYILVGFLLHHAYSNYKLSKVNVVWSCLSIIIATGLGYFIYDEHMNVNNFISVIAALISIYFATLN